jgi:protein-tyrosine kinase
MAKMKDVLSQRGRKVDRQMRDAGASSSRGSRPEAPLEPGLSSDQAILLEEQDMEYQGAPVKRARRKPVRRSRSGRRPPRRHVHHEDRERLVSLYAPYSPQAKRIDILRSQLLYPFHGDPPRIVMITSSVSGEGNSLLASNLAISFARGLQQYVMVMDCNMLRPAINETFGVPLRPGLSDYLEGNSTDLADVMHWTKVDKLSVIPAGSPSSRSAEILATDRMAAMLEELKDRYNDRYIILDAPPVQAVDDPSVLARLVEGIIFVVASGTTDREVAMRALSRLPEDRIIGIVMNDKASAVSDAASVSPVPDIGD